MKPVPQAQCLSSTNRNQSKNSYLQCGWEGGGGPSVFKLNLRRKHFKNNILVVKFLSPNEKILKTFIEI